MNIVSHRLALATRVRVAAAVADPLPASLLWMSVQSGDPKAAATQALMVSRPSHTSLDCTLMVSRAAAAQALMVSRLALNPSVFIQDRHTVQSLMRLLDVTVLARVRRKQVESQCTVSCKEAACSSTSRKLMAPSALGPGGGGGCGRRRRG